MKILRQTDYAAVLKEIEALFDSKPGSHEADRLDILATLIEVYEHRHFPIETPDPISAIKFRMDVIT
jgi:HTH-type transcriptional regulator/antitoxin HigA